MTFTRTGIGSGGPIGEGIARETSVSGGTTRGRFGGRRGLVHQLACLHIDESKPTGSGAYKALGGVGGIGAAVKECHTGWSTQRSLVSCNGKRAENR